MFKNLGQSLINLIDLEAITKKLTVLITRR